MNRLHYPEKIEIARCRYKVRQLRVFLAFCLLLILACCGPEYPIPEDVKYISVSPQADAIYYGNGLAFLANKHIVGTARLDGLPRESGTFLIDRFYWQDSQNAAASGIYDHSGRKIVRFYGIESGKVEITGETDLSYDTRYPFPTSTAGLWLSGCRADMRDDFNICLIGPDSQTDSYIPDFLANEKQNKPFTFGDFDGDYFYLDWKSDTGDDYNHAVIKKIELYSETVTDICRIATRIPEDEKEHPTIRYLPAVGKFALITLGGYNEGILSLIDPEQRKENGDCVIEHVGQSDVLGVFKDNKDRLIILHSVYEEVNGMSKSVEKLVEYDIATGQNREIYRWPETLNTVFAASVAQEASLIAVGPAILGPPKDGQNLYYILLVAIADGTITKLAKSTDQNVEK